MYSVSITGRALAASILSILLVVVVVLVLWTLLWKFIIEPNPLIRQFFDLDKQARKKAGGGGGPLQQPLPVDKLDKNS